MRVHISTIPERSFLSLATGKPIALPLHSPYPLDGAPFRQTTAECLTAAVLFLQQDSLDLLSCTISPPRAPGDCHDVARCRADDSCHGRSPADLLLGTRTTTVHLQPPATAPWATVKPVVSDYG